MNKLKCESRISTLYRSLGQYLRERIYERAGYLQYMKEPSVEDFAGDESKEEGHHVLDTADPTVCTGQKLTADVFGA